MKKIVVAIARKENEMILYREKDYGDEVVIQTIFL